MAKGFNGQSLAEDISTSRLTLFSANCMQMKEISTTIVIPFQ